MKRMRATVSTLAILGSLGMIQNVSAVPVPGDCPDVNFGVSERSSAVISADPDQDTSGNWVYRYRVCNTTDPYYAGGFGNNVIVDWELPWFDDAQISDIVTPIGWRWSIEEVGVQNFATGWGTEDTNGDGDIDADDAVPGWSIDGDPWKDIFDTAYGGAANNPFTNVEKVLHFYTESFQAETLAAVAEEQEFCDLIFEGDNCAGFGFSSPFNAGDAPYQASWLFLPVRTGDPLFPLGQNGGGIPNSPSIQRATIPEPATAALIGVGLLSVAAQRRRRRKQ